MLHFNTVPEDYVRKTNQYAQVALACGRAAHQTAIRGATSPNPQLAALTPKDNLQSECYRKLLKGLVKRMVVYAIIESIALNSLLDGDAVLADLIMPITPQVRAFVERSAALCQPEHVHVCDGSEAEASALLHIMQQQGTLKRLPKYDNCWLARTDPADVARVESRTFICSEKERDVVPIARAGQKSALGNYIAPDDYEKAITERFPGCMRGKRKISQKWKLYGEKKKQKTIISFRYNNENESRSSKCPIYADRDIKGSVGTSIQCDPLLPSAVMNVYIKSVFVYECMPHDVRDPILDGSRRISSFQDRSGDHRLTIRRLLHACHD
ncbi:hypothetical protein HF086_008531 [Spodoptera exigua]|uniref:Phosphoenolpyruvate carboxykinase GTP-utilising N-terminal domain-containing protein n=1 Tax=Spodoptera exigua TaxID=7107 RepID=A0A922M2G7_SPOEX|nr:hypothetical protein HF086_008531 [Spodoptera exigua]